MNELSQKELVEQIESLKKELAEAQRQNQLIPSYLAGLAHDIRTPLNAILGFAELLGDSDVDIEELGFYSGMITRGSKRLLNTVSNLIDFAKLETDNFKIHSERVVISELFTELEEELMTELRLYGKENIKFSFQCPINGSGVLHSDRNKLHQILRILLDNSIKFTAKGEIEVISRVHKEGIGFSIRDTGNGMDKNTLDNVFTMFSSQSLEKGQRLKSRGLGMVVANRLVQMLNGEMEIASKPMVGTTVSISIPY